jgi:hypothetical protein
MKKSYLIILLMSLAFACKTPYQPKVNDTDASYLVIEGIINSNNGSTDSTFIKLSRTINLSAAAKTVKPETRAVVSVEDGQGYNFAMRELSGGRYVSGPLGLTSTKKYRLRIKTADGKVYLSDLEPVIYTPPIDSIGYKILDNSIQIYANTHNPADNTRYYRWDFSETWRFHVAFHSDFMASGGKVVRRPPEKKVFYCYANDLSNEIAIASSGKLTKDVIYQAPVTQIEETSEKVSMRYSMLLRQYGLTQDGFKFWEVIKKNSEQIGSIFSAQPSQINGNIHCMTNPAEIVFGYVSITNVQTKRVYINNSDLPSRFAPVYKGCVPDSALFADGRFGLPPVNTVETFILSGHYIPIDSIPKLGYYAGSHECTDCTTRGVLTKPYFWVD